MNDNTNISPINDLSSKTFDELFNRFQKLDTEKLLVYLFDKVDESALVHLAEGSLIIVVTIFIKTTNKTPEWAKEAARKRIKKL